MIENDNNLVSSTQSGLITPGLVDELDLLESISPLKGLKILPNINAYWYYFQSRFNLIEFKPLNNILALDLNTNKLLQQCHKYACPGTKGAVGEKGFSGEDGTPGPNENLYTPELGSDPTILILDAVVETPLETSISIRLFRSSEQCIEIVFDPNTKTTFIKESCINFEIQNIEYVENRLIIELSREEEWEIGWTYKARQIGPTGAAGTPGDNFLSILDVYADDLNSLSAVATLRRIEDLSHLIYSRQTMDNFTASKLRVRESGGIADIVPESDPCCASCKSRFPTMLASVSPTANDVKAIQRWGMNLGPDFSCSIPLAFPVWGPTDACANTYPQGIPTLPFVRIPSEPVVRCCQEDAFYCGGDVHDVDCVIDPFPPTPPTPPTPPPIGSDACQITLNIEENKCSGGAKDVFVRLTGDMCYYIDEADSCGGLRNVIRIFAAGNTTIVAEFFADLGSCVHHLKPKINGTIVQWDSGANNLDALDTDSVTLLEDDELIIYLENEGGCGVDGDHNDDGGRATWAIVSCPSCTPPGPSSSSSSSSTQGDGKCRCVYLFYAFFDNIACEWLTPVIAATPLCTCDSVPRYLTPDGDHWRFVSKWNEYGNEICIYEYGVVTSTECNDGTGPECDDVSVIPQTPTHPASHENCDCIGSSSSSSSSFTPPPSSSSSSSGGCAGQPEVLVTISGLSGGKTWNGLGNGIYSLCPTAYSFFSYTASTWTTTGPWMLVFYSASQQENWVYNATDDISLLAAAAAGPTTQPMPIMKYGGTKRSTGVVNWSVSGVIKSYSTFGTSPTQQMYGRVKNRLFAAYTFGAVTITLSRGADWPAPRPGYNEW